MTSGTAPEALIDALRKVFDSSHHAVIDRMIRDWPTGGSVSDHAGPNDVLPVVDYLPQTIDNTATQTAILARMLCGCRNELTWQQTYTAEDLGQTFLDRYGWTMLVGPGATLESTNLLSGFLLLGPGVEYPVHTHSAEEIYLVVSGTASWTIGGSDWQVINPGSIIHNPPWQPHGIRTAAEQPLLLAYLWSASGVEKSTFQTTGNRP